MTIEQMYCDLADDLRFQLYDKNKETIQYIFKGNIERVGGTPSAPLWRVQKTYIN